MKAAKKGGESYDFYTFEVTSIRKAPKDMLINYRLNQYELEKPKKAEQLGKFSFSMNVHKCDLSFELFPQENLSMKMLSGFLLILSHGPGR